MEKETYYKRMSNKTETDVEKAIKRLDMKESAGKRILDLILATDLAFVACVNDLDKRLRKLETKK